MYDFPTSAGNAWAQAPNYEMPWHEHAYKHANQPITPYNLIYAQLAQRTELEPQNTKETLRWLLVAQVRPFVAHSQMRHFASNVYLLDDLLVMEGLVLLVVRRARAPPSLTLRSTISTWTTFRRRT